MWAWRRAERAERRAQSGESHKKDGWMNGRLDEKDGEDKETLTTITRAILGLKIGLRRIRDTLNATVKAIRNMWKRTGKLRGCVTGEKSSVLIYKPS